jgi:hypothetical protein
LKARLRESEDALAVWIQVATSGQEELPAARMHCDSIFRGWWTRRKVAVVEEE